MSSLNPTDHILTQLELTNNPGAIPNTYTNFGAVPTPIFIQRPSSTYRYDNNMAQNVDLNNLGNSLNESRLALAMEMARLDVERMKFVEAPITITTSSNSNSTKTHQKDRTTAANALHSNSGGSKSALKQKDPHPIKTSHQKNGAATSSTTPHQQPLLPLSNSKNVEEINKVRCEILECITLMTFKASQPKAPVLREIDEEQKLENRVNQQTIRCARTLYSLQQQIRQVQTDVDKINGTDDANLNAQGGVSQSSSHKMVLQINSVLTKILTIHRGVAKICKEVSTVSREGNGIEKQFSRTYSELAHLIRQLTLVNDQLGVESVDCHVELLDGLSAGEVVSKNYKNNPNPKNQSSYGDHALTAVNSKTVKLNLPNDVGEFALEENTAAAAYRPLSPDREETLRAGIIALGIDKILDKNKAEHGKKSQKETNIVSHQNKGPSKNKKTVIYTTTRSRVPVKLNSKNVKSNILQSTVASQLKSVHSDMLIRDPISDFAVTTSNNRSGIKPTSSSPINYRSTESLNRLRDIDESTILSSSRHDSSLSPARRNGNSGKTKTGGRGKDRSSSPVRRTVSPTSNRSDRINIATHEQAEKELKTYVKETEKLVSEMKQEREMTKRLFDSKKGFSLEAYNDIREICKLKLQGFTVGDRDARAVMIRLTEMTDPTFRYLVKECSLGFKTFDYETIADRILDFLVEQRLEQTNLLSLKNVKRKPSPLIVGKDRAGSRLDSSKKKNIECMREMLQRIENIEKVEDEISQRLHSDDFALRAVSSGFDPDKENCSGIRGIRSSSMRNVHFRDYPSVIGSPRKWFGDEGEMIIVNKSRCGTTQVADNVVKEGDSNPDDDGYANVGRTEIGVDEQVLRAIENERITKQASLESKHLTSTHLLDQVTADILSDCLNDVFNEFSDVCDGFAQQVFVEEFQPSEL